MSVGIGEEEHREKELEMENEEYTHHHTWTKTLIHFESHPFYPLSYSIRVASPSRRIAIASYIDNFYS